MVGWRPCPCTTARGGGTPWETITYDPELNLVYIGTGNGSPWNRKFRSPAGGDNLYLASIVALSADTGKYVWHYQETPGDNWDYDSPWNGGTTTTAGNLVFQGTADGRFVTYNAKTGEKLWEAPTGTGVVAGPATYMVDGTQYVSIAVGWGGVYGEAARATDVEMPGTVFTFALGGDAKPPLFAKMEPLKLVEGVEYKPEDVGPGTLLYVSNCAFCHGVPGVDKGGNIKNLGYSSAETIGHLKDTVFKGPFMGRGTPDFSGKLSEDDVSKIAALIQSTADTIRPKRQTAHASLLGGEALVSIARRSDLGRASRSHHSRSCRRPGRMPHDQEFFALYRRGPSPSSRGLHRAQQSRRKMRRN